LAFLLLEHIYIAHVSRQFDGSGRCSVIVCLTQVRPVTCCL